MVEEAPHPDGELETYGSPLYMAPEILLQGSLNLTGRIMYLLTSAAAEHGKPVDVWAVGVLTFFVISGCTPFDRDTPELQRDAIIAGEYKFAPDGKWEYLSVNARDFIAMCLTIDPDRRPAAGEALTHTVCGCPSSLHLIVNPE